MSRSYLCAPIALVSMFLLVAPMACSSGTPADGGGAGDSQFTSETVDGVPTVTTTAGSKWGGPAILEEELSIGVLEGDETAMFGQVDGVWMTDDAILVVDGQAPALRVYDRSGNYLRDIGQPGPGPGEYEHPSGIAVTGDGRIYLQSGQGVNVYGPDGEYESSWKPEGNIRFGGNLVAESDGEVYTSYVDTSGMERGGMRNFQNLKRGMAAINLEGGYGEPIYPPDSDYESPTVEVNLGNFSLDLPAVGAPRRAWGMGPDGTMAVGVGTDYKFEIVRPDGSVTAVERYWDPVPLQAAEAEEQAELLYSMVPQRDPEWEYDGPAFPTHKPAFGNLTIDLNGRVWVDRAGVGTLDLDCEEDDKEGGSNMVSDGGRVMISIGGGGGCWSSPSIRDVFDSDGSYLGEVIQPRGVEFSGGLYIKDDVVLAAVEDEDGTVMVKLYRLRTGADAIAT